jgi:putative transposase
LTLAGYPHHVIQRGNNRQAVFLTASDREFFLQLLADNAKVFQVAVHAYVLMDNHFHLLMTPANTDGLPKMMQAIGRRYVRHFNDSHGRSGTLWEGRYKSTVIQSDRYLLACMAYIDLNPVRAAMEQQPADFPWSSHRHYTGQSLSALISPHPLLWGLGNTPFSREAAYTELVQAGVSPVQQAALTDSALKGWALGESQFVADLQRKVDRRVDRRSPGRPLSSLLK